MEVLLLVLLLLWAALIVAVILVANSRNRSRHYAWWAVFLGSVGAVIAMAVILVQAEKPASRRLVEPATPAPGPSWKRRALRGNLGARWVRHYLHECSDCTRKGPLCPTGRDLWAAESLVTRGQGS